MTADARSLRLALGMLFLFGMGAAVPMLAAGRVARLVVRPFAEGLLTGMASKRILGLALIALAIAGLTGLDLALVQWVDGILPSGFHNLATIF